MKRREWKGVTLKRKNFFPTLVVTISLWMSFLLITYFVDPDLPGAVILFFIIIFFMILFTCSLLFANSRKGLIVSTAFTFFLMLSYLGVGNILNLILIVAIAVCIELYFGLR